jgi:hypothetical protein
MAILSELLSLLAAKMLQIRNWGHAAAACHAPACLPTAAAAGRRRGRH